MWVFKRRERVKMMLFFRYSDNSDEDRLLVDYFFYTIQHRTTDLLVFELIHFSISFTIPASRIVMFRNI
uniref:Uncharacterized protein n=1 Tax=Octopus bimaculoides TaxID=37653 RepID=A0A0L8GPL2_OCTBM